MFHSSLRGLGPCSARGTESATSANRMGIVLAAFTAAAVVTDPQDMRLGRSVGANGMPVKNALDMRPSELECARDGHKLVTIEILAGIL